MFKENEKSRAICSCKGLVTTTFLYRDVPFSDKSGIVKNILVGVCDECSSVVSVLPQTTPQIKEALTQIRK